MTPSQTVEVTVLTDSDDEGQETLTLTLSNPGQATLDDASGIGAIENGESTSTTEDPPAEEPVVLLTADFVNVPADHNGSNFTFQLNFSEDVNAGYARVKNHVFTVDGGTIANAYRQTPGSNQGWNVKVDPTGNERRSPSPCPRPPTAPTAAPSAPMTAESSPIPHQ